MIQGIGKEEGEKNWKIFKIMITVIDEVDMIEY